MGDRATALELGVISDTHGYLDPMVFGVLDGVDRILHAGDVGTEEVAVELATIAPVTAVSGNVDAHLPPARFPSHQLVQAGARRILIVHVGLSRGLPVPPLQPLLEAHDPDLVVFGHSHEPHFGRWGRCCFFNPGSAGKKRFRLPRTLGRLVVDGRGRIVGRLISLEGRREDEMEFVILEAPS